MLVLQAVGTPADDEVALDVDVVLVHHGGAPLVPVVRRVYAVVVVGGGGGVHAEGEGAETGMDVEASVYK